MSFLAETETVFGIADAVDLLEHHVQVRRPGQGTQGIQHDVIGTLQIVAAVALFLQAIEIEVVHAAHLLVLPDQHGVSLEEVGNVLGLLIFAVGDHILVELALSQNLVCGHLSDLLPLDITNVHYFATSSAAAPGASSAVQVSRISSMLYMVNSLTICHLPLIFFTVAILMAMQASELRGLLVAAP